MKQQSTECFHYLMFQYSVFEIWGDIVAVSYDTVMWGHHYTHKRDARNISSMM